LVIAVIALILALAAVLFAVQSTGSNGGGAPQFGNYSLSAADLAKRATAKRIFRFAGVVPSGQSHTVASVGPFKVQFTCNDGGTAGQAGWLIKNVGKNHSLGQGDDGTDYDFNIGESDVEANNDDDAGDGMGAISPNGYAVTSSPDVSLDANGSGAPMAANGCVGAGAVLSVGKG